MFRDSDTLLHMAALLAPSSDPRERSRIRCSLCRVCRQWKLVFSRHADAVRHVLAHEMGVRNTRLMTSLSALVWQGEIAKVFEDKFSGPKLSLSTYERHPWLANKEILRSYHHEKLPALTYHGVAIAELLPHLPHWQVEDLQRNAWSVGDSGLDSDSEPDDLEIESSKKHEETPRQGTKIGGILIPSIDTFPKPRAHFVVFAHCDVPLAIARWMAGNHPRMACVRGVSPAYGDSVFGATDLQRSQQACAREEAAWVHKRCRLRVRPFWMRWTVQKRRRMGVFGVEWPIGDPSGLLSYLALVPAGWGLHDFSKQIDPLLQGCLGDGMLSLWVGTLAPGNTDVRVVDWQLTTVGGVATMDPESREALAAFLLEVREEARHLLKLTDHSDSEDLLAAVMRSVEYVQ